MFFWIRLNRVCDGNITQQVQIEQKQGLEYSILSFLPKESIYLK